MTVRADGNFRRNFAFSVTDEKNAGPREKTNLCVRGAANEVVEVHDERDEHRDTRRRTQPEHVSAVVRAPSEIAEGLSDDRERIVADRVYDYRPEQTYQARDRAQLSPPTGK
jgi:hypothetical protein